jgi:S-formylglutathione hydrolase
MSEITLVSKAAAFGGTTEFYSHVSTSCQAEMRFSVFVPPAAKTKKVPMLTWLSGLTCTEENFMAKAGAQRLASELGILIVAPDTSPRGLNLPHDSESYDFGVGAGFYVNATESPWNKHYRMFDYVTQELPGLVAKHFPVSGKQSIFGHSMGGHGALVAALRNPGKYASVSAFAPIVAPSLCPWGQKAFTGYLGKNGWENYDAHLLVRGDLSVRQPLFMDQGSADKFLKDQLMPEKLLEACEKVGHPVVYRLREGYDHSYYYIQSFIEEHLRYHAGFLFGAGE